MKEPFVEFFWNESICILKLIFLASNVNTTGDDLESFYTDTDAKEIQALFGVKTTDKKLEALEDEDQYDELTKEILEAGKTGYLIKVGTPIPLSFNAMGSPSYSFGSLYTKWFYTDELSVGWMLSQLVPWRRQLYAKKKKQLAKKEKAV